MNIEYSFYDLLKLIGTFDYIALWNGCNFNILSLNNIKVCL